MGREVIKISGKLKDLLSQSVLEQHASTHSRFVRFLEITPGTYLPDTQNFSIFEGKKLMWDDTIPYINVNVFLPDTTK